MLLRSAKFDATNSSNSRGLTAPGKHAASRKHAVSKNSRGPTARGTQAATKNSRGPTARGRCANSLRGLLAPGYFYSRCAPLLCCGVFAVLAASTAWANPYANAASTFAPPHPAVVRVVSPDSDGVSYGSGSLVAVDETSGLVLTNWHVVRDSAGTIVVHFPDGFRSAAVVLRVDHDWDLAALAIRRPNVFRPAAIIRPRWSS